ncbi:Aldo/keto reductase [Periconia macrospinosa]|uniref:Aldo/keto reductase n=1 Tax=Periconia macrospinosa TaxID=97972 RepID=A0A2V1DE27_9PLEO|nr:Aldo/keto reductase [Periconia macrospinosa]
MSPKTKLDIIFGAMTFGEEGKHGVRTSDLATCSSILDTFQAHGHNEVDTSRVYGLGTSEEYLGALDWSSRKLSVHTKFYPNAAGGYGFSATHLTEGDMRKAVEESAEALKLKGAGDGKIDLWYLHGPDRTVPLEETLAVVNAMFKEGKFKRWGISNYMSWEVAAICEICLKNNYPLPSVYQGLYNALHRTVEHELLPCLRKYNIAFYAFNPLAGGYLTDRYARDTTAANIEPGSRFDATNIQGKMYRMRYWNDAFFDALDVVRPAVKAKGLRESEAALRWIVNHSMLKREYGDKVIIGASSGKQLEMNLADLEGAELDGEVLEALDKGWEITRGIAWKYFH